MREMETHEETGDRWHTLHDQWAFSRHKENPRKQFHSVDLLTVIVF